MSTADGEELGPLLEEQRAYYRALAPDYLDQVLDLPGGDEGRRGAPARLGRPGARGAAPPALTFMRTIV